MLLLTLLVILSGITISIVGFSLYTGISPMPSSRKVKKSILANLPHEAKSIYELGSGWGTLALPIARKLSDAKLHAFELSFIPWFVSSIIQKIVKCSTLRIYRKNFLNTSLKDADLVVCYLFPGAMRNLKTKFEEELKPGTWVFSNSFSIPGWKPEKIIYINDLWKSELFIYKIA